MRKFQLEADEIKRRCTAQEAAHDASVEVLVGEETEHETVLHALTGAETRANLLNVGMWLQALHFGASACNLAETAKPQNRP